MEEQKKCFKCGQVKPLDEFYRHKGMRDGRLSKCKACTKADVQNNYRGTRGEQQEYERKREQSPERRARKLEYARRARKAHPEKYRANTAINNAIRDGEVVRGPCEAEGCERPAEAHHEDYSKPLKVRWLCRKHHRAEHGQVAD